jgi:hypothetical protein
LWHGNDDLAKFGQRNAGNGIRQCAGEDDGSFPTARKPRGEPVFRVYLIRPPAPLQLTNAHRSSPKQSITKRHTALFAISSERTTPTFRSHVREHRTQGYVSQRPIVAFPPSAQLLVFLSFFLTPNTMRPLVHFAVRASRSSRALRAFKPTPNRFFHTSPRSLCPDSQNENDDDYRTIAHMTPPLQRATMLTTFLHRRVCPHPRRAR